VADNLSTPAAEPTDSTEPTGTSVSIEAELPRELFEALKELALRRGLDANTVLQQAIQTEKLLADNVGIDDEVLIKKSNNSYSRVLFERTS
jgi:hypothetical protein